MIYIETANINYNNLNMNKSIYDFILAHQDDSKKLLRSNFSFGGNFQQYIKTYLSGIDMQNDNKFHLLTNKSSKYLFYWYSNFVEWKKLPLPKIRHLKISEGFAGLVKIQESSWQYLIENFIAQNFDLKGKIAEKEPKSLKEIKKTLQDLQMRVQHHLWDNCWKLSWISTHTRVWWDWRN